jgi:hypothetical protein
MQDRLSGMISVFMFAVLTDRAFLVDWETPWPLAAFFESPHIAWRFDKKLIATEMPTVERFYMSGIASNNLPSLDSTNNVVNMTSFNQILNKDQN